MTPHVTVKHRVTGQGYPFTESFVYYGGATYYSRHWSVIADTPHAKQALAQQFLDRLKRFPSCTTEYERQLDGVRDAMKSDLVTFAKAGGPPPQRAGLRVVK